MKKFRNFAVRLGLALGLSGSMGVSGLAAGALSPEQAPAAWVAYAQTATGTVTGWLNADTAPGPRLRETLNAHRPRSDQPIPPLLVKLWVEQDGVITRVEAPPLGDEQADKDLHVLILGQHLPPPPQDMRLPMRLAIQLAPPRIGGKP